MTRAVRRPWFGPYREIMAIITKGFQTVITDPTADPDQVLKEVQEEGQEILDEYYY